MMLTGVTGILTLDADAILCMIIAMTLVELAMLRGAAITGILIIPHAKAHAAIISRFSLGSITTPAVHAPATDILTWNTLKTVLVLGEETTTDTDSVKEMETGTSDRVGSIKIPIPLDTVSGRDQAPRNAGTKTMRISLAMRRRATRELGWEKKR